MRKHIADHYKSFDGNVSNDLDRKMNECFNDYGYNLESNKRKTISLDEIACKSGPLCLQKYNRTK